MNILMVCLGNICRSPLAEGILRKKIKNITIDSAGTAGYHVGSPPDSRSIDIARKYNIDISTQRARKFDISDFNKFDIIYVMDNQNYDNLIKLAKTEENKKKVKLILNEISPGENRCVPDPYYGGKNGFEIVYNMLEKACEKIALSID